MKQNIDPIRLIFGLKLKQFRSDKGLSLKELSELCDISPSYLNEIEKGKKYPKTDKIQGIADALDLEYDQLVSTDLKKALGPTGEILKKNFFTDVPFEFFGIDPGQIIEIIANAPVKFSALVNTLIKIGRSYNVSVEKLYFAVLRSYLEIHKNYFPELEAIADSFPIEATQNEAALKKYLREEYKITTDSYNPSKFPALAGLRTVLVPKTKKFFLNQNLTENQRFFAISKEIGFRYMNEKVRPLTSTWVSVHSFEEVFNNFKASYFASCILIRKEVIITDFTNFFNAKKFSKKSLFSILDQFNASPETVFYRIFSIFPEFFGLEKLYFLKFESKQGTRDARLTKEIHLVGQHDPQESRAEHYCRRWPGISVLDDILEETSTSRLVKSQISQFETKGKNKYFEIALAKSTASGGQESITLGFEINEETKKKIAFLDDPKIVEKTVGQTCEKCSLFDCKERIAAPTVLYKERQLSEINKAIDQLK